MLFIIFPRPILNGHLRPQNEYGYGYDFYLAHQFNAFAFALALAAACSSDQTDADDQCPDQTDADADADGSESDAHDYALARKGLLFLRQLTRWRPTLKPIRFLRHITYLFNLYTEIKIKHI
jgi:hypothetical protein